MATTQPSFGTQFWLEDKDALTQLVFVSEIMDVTGPSIARETVDATTHQSPDGFREHIATLKDGGDISFQLRYDPSDTGHILVQESITGGPVNGLGARVYFPTNDGDYVEFNCIPTGFNIGAPVSGFLTVDFTAKVTGPVSFYSTSNPSASGLYT